MYYAMYQILWELYALCNDFKFEEIRFQSAWNEVNKVKASNTKSQASKPGNLLFPLWKTALPAICKCVLHDSWCTFSFSNVVQAEEILHWNGFELKAKQSISSTPHNAQSWKITQKVVWPKIQTSSRYLFLVAKRVKGGKVKAIAITGKERQ